jgi:hypothetical protein
MDPHACGRQADHLNLDFCRFVWDDNIVEVWVDLQDKYYCIRKFVRLRRIRNSYFPVNNTSS